MSGARSAADSQERASLFAPRHFRDHFSYQARPRRQAFQLKAWKHIRAGDTRSSSCTSQTTPVSQTTTPGASKIPKAQQRLAHYPQRANPGPWQGSGTLHRRKQPSQHQLCKARGLPTKTRFSV